MSLLGQGQADEEADVTKARVKAEAEAKAEDEAEAEDEVKPKAKRDDNFAGNDDVDVDACLLIRYGQSTAEAATASGTAQSTLASRDKCSW